MRRRPARVADRPHRAWRMSDRPGDLLRHPERKHRDERGRAVGRAEHGAPHGRAALRLRSDLAVGGRGATRARYRRARAARCPACLRISPGRQRQLLGARRRAAAGASARGGLHRLRAGPCARPHQYARPAQGAGRGLLRARSIGTAGVLREWRRRPRSGAHHLRLPRLRRASLQSRCWRRCRR